jgi:peroxiredoxin
MLHKGKLYFIIIILALFSSVTIAYSLSEQFKGKIYNPGTLKPIDSIVKLKVGDRAPDFSLPAVSWEKISLNQYLGKKNIVISFVPAAWTPVCSDQWPGYNIIKNIFDKNDAILIGITVDNIPTLYAWTNEMGNLWFPVLSDFWPHGAVATKYGVLRSDGVSERALFVIDKKGIIRYIDVHDINQRPYLEVLVKELEKLG